MHCAAQDLAGSGFWQTGNNQHCLEARDRADAVANERDGFALDLVRGLVRGAFDAGLENQEAQRDLAFQCVGNTDHGTFRDVGMGRQHLLDLPGRRAVGGDIDDVVSAGHPVDIPVRID